MRSFEHLHNFNKIFCWSLRQELTSKSPNARNQYMHQPFDQPLQRNTTHSSCNRKQEVASFSVQRALPKPSYYLFHICMDEVKEKRKLFILVSINIKYLSHKASGHYHTRTYIVSFLEVLHIYITTSFNLCSICIHSTTKFKLISLLCTHVYSYIL